MAIDCGVHGKCDIFTTLKTVANYSYRWIPASLVPEDLLGDMASLYSEHYGTWGERSPKRFQQVRLSTGRIREWLAHRDARLAYAELDGQLVGYAIAVQPTVPNLGVISWVTQLVVHSDHRRQDVGKRLLYSIWEFSDHFAWGLVTANPYAVRALEKATRRRCSPEQITRHAQRLLTVGAEYIPYLKAHTECVATTDSSRINTEFFIDHMDLPNMLTDVTKSETPWTLGSLPEGWEWLAFTFKNQQDIGLTAIEIETMLQTSDEVAKHAYMRMRLNESHGWARHTQGEVDLIMRECALSSGSTVLDIGCGSGRHLRALGKQGVFGTGIDYLQEAIEELAAVGQFNNQVQLIVGDARSLSLDKSFDAVLCLYDVIGSFANEHDNEMIVRSIRRHLRPGGRALLSVMNFDLTYRNARHRFSLAREPNRLLDLPASNTMENTGNVFNPDYYMIDDFTEIVYRKEQFTTGTDLPVQLLVRDRRYRRRDIEAICMNAGLDIIWTKYVRAGQWDNELSDDDEHAKEILLLCQARE